MQEPLASGSAHEHHEAPGTTGASMGPIVGVGASAGGLDAFSRFLRHLPPETGYAFVLVQHLDASHPSSLSEILGRATAMPVAEVQDGMPVAPNRVYVIPPNTELTIAGRALTLAPRAASAQHMPVDRFLRSLADDCGHLAVGVILSGNGSDGAAGLMAIKDAGGMTFAQEPSSAEFPSMPSMAAAAGAADVVLPPEAIAAELVRIARDPHFALSRTAADVNQGDDEVEPLRAICDVMREATGIDYSLYRETTVRRRILRRLAIRNIDGLASYARAIADDPGERAALQRDLLISVTSFFRDPEAFDALKALVFPALVRQRPAEATIRIWVPGCATGEEAYSILIALHEFQRDERTRFAVQLFASDISEAAIEKARTGRYGEHVAADVGSDRLHEYFSYSPSEHVYRITKELREQCVFSRHNLLDDPPFSRVDLISCRNVLIYLDPAQRKIIPLFHYALVEHGFLMLGRSETTHHDDLFTVVEPRQRIYSRRYVARKRYTSFVRTQAGQRRGDGPAAVVAPMRGAADVSRDVDRLLLSKYSPSGVVVDENLDVLEIRGQPAPFLALAAGKASYQLAKLLPDTGLYLEVEKLIRDAAASGAAVRREHLPFQVGAQAGELAVDVTRVGSAERRAFLVLFEATSPAGADRSTEERQPSDAGDDTPARDARVEQLSRDLVEARARLVALIDEHSASDEDNQQITEDALSANEELQSLTEELETAKEELQSTNEELLTVNQELESRNLALVSALELAKATIETVGVPLVVVDEGLVVRHLNAAFAATFHASPIGNEGRPFFEMCGGAWNVDDIRDRLVALVRHRQPFDGLELEHEFPPVGTLALTIGGCSLEGLGLILLTIEDMTKRREAERALQRSEEQRRQGEKMETIGRLAGGIAHDFNNLLTVIIGNASLVGDMLGPGHDVAEQVSDIRRSAERAAVLTDQLLSFSRRKILQPRVFDLNPLVADFERMLGRLLGEAIKIVVRRSVEACLVRADPAEIGRVVMNLSVNARDAMPAGGVLTIETSHVSLGEADAGRDGLVAGRYVRLIVGDTGLGMDAEARRHAFEPFFTTKDASQGAGLGLAAVFGILRQSGGAVTCDSALGEGSRFTMLLPAVAPSADPAPGVDPPTQAPRGTLEVVLLVEDDDAVRELTRRVLERSGYVVLDAKSGPEALSVLQSHQGPIDLLVSDVLMPEMSGGVLAARATSLRPALKVLFVSGHTEDVVVREGVTKGMPFLPKPYGPAELVRKIRDVLDAGGS